MSILTIIFWIVISFGGAILCKEMIEDTSSKTLKIIAIICLGFIIVLGIADISKKLEANATTMTAKVEESEMRACIERCGYVFK